jgi:thymidine kinase
MAKLFFRYSAMDAGKTLDLLKVAFNYQDRGKHTLILTSVIDSRSGMHKVKSRIGFDKTAISTKSTDNLFDLVKSENAKTPLACILVDEIHFFSTEQVKQLSDVLDYLEIPVICYGLRTDYCGRVFDAAGYLLAIADSIEELKTICHCGRKATFNMLVKNNVAIKDGSPVVVDDDALKNINTRYYSVCRRCWKENKIN